MCSVRRGLDHPLYGYGATGRNRTADLLMVNQRYNVTRVVNSIEEAPEKVSFHLFFNMPRAAASRLLRFAAVFRSFHLAVSLRVANRNAVEATCARLARNTWAVFPTRNVAISSISAPKLGARGRVTPMRELAQLQIRWVAASSGFVGMTGAQAATDCPRGGPILKHHQP